MQEHIYIFQFPFQCVGEQEHLNIIGLDIDSSLHDKFSKMLAQLGKGKQETKIFESQL